MMSAQAAVEDFLLKAVVYGQVVHSWTGHHLFANRLNKENSRLIFGENHICFGKSELFDDSCTGYSTLYTMVSI